MFQVLEKSCAKFEVLADGFPTPSVTWFKDGVEIKVGDAMKYSVEAHEDGRSCLIISNCGEDDDAEYSCQASNSLGNVATKAELYVEPFGERLPPHASDC